MVFSKSVLVYAAMAFILLFCFVSIFIAPSYMDELNYHYPMAQSISLQQAINPGSDYNSAYPPLPYFVANLFLRINSSLIILRFLNFAIFLLAVWFFYQLAKKLTKDHLVLTLLFFLNPYLLKASYMFLLYNWGLLFMLIALNVYFPQGKWRHWSGDFFMLLAVLCQQWMLVVVLALLLYRLDLYLRKQITLGLLMKSFTGKFFVFLPALLLFYKWGGLTHPNFASHALHPTFEHLSGILANVGLLMLIVVLANFKTIFKKSNVLPLLPLPLLWLAIPRHSIGQGPQEISGVVSQLATKADVLLHMPYALTMFLFIVAGYLLLLLILQNHKEGLPKFFLYAVLGFFIAFVASARLAASHIYISLPLLLLLLRGEIEEMRAGKIWLIAQFFSFSVVYIVYITFFRSQGISF